VEKVETMAHGRIILRIHLHEFSTSLITERLFKGFCRRFFAGYDPSECNTERGDPNFQTIFNDC
jgi:hypothetical protein